MPPAYVKPYVERQKNGTTKSLRPGYSMLAVSAGLIFDQKHRFEFALWARAETAI